MPTYLCVKAVNVPSRTPATGILPNHRSIGRHILGNHRTRGRSANITGQLRRRPPMMRDEIAKIIFERKLQAPWNMVGGRSDYERKFSLECADQILALIAPELEKAEKWDKVEEIARGFCNECPLKGCEQYEFVNPCEAVEDIVKTLNQPDEVKEENHV